MACDLLTLLISIVVLESTFNIAGRMMTDMRNLPVSEVIKMSICKKDRLDAKTGSYNKIVDEIIEDSPEDD